MKLLTIEIIKNLPALYSQEDVKDPIVQVKFFNPAGLGTWYGIEYDGEDTFFGLCVIQEAELGYFSLSELQSIRLPFGLSIERDLWFKPQPLSKVREIENNIL